MCAPDRWRLLGSEERVLEVWEARKWMNSIADGADELSRGKHLLMID